MKTFAKCIIYVVVLAFLFGIIGVIYKYTNGFNEDFKTFYIEYNGEQILTTENKMEFKTWEIHKFGVKYTFDKDEAEPRDYFVKILPNMTKDFDYTVNGERYLFSKITDLTKAFEIDKGDSSFMLCLPNVFTLQTALENYHDGKSVVIPKNVESENAYPFKMVVSSYNNSIVYNILFKVVNQDGAKGNTGGGTSGNTGGGTSGNTGSGTNGNTGGGNSGTVDGEYYFIDFDTLGNGSNAHINLSCPATAKAGDKITFTVSLYDLSDVYDDYEPLEITAIRLNYADSGDEIDYLGDGEGAFSFIMPAANVTIMFYLMYA